MAKLPLVGPPYPARSLAAAASELTNLYPELIENPDDRGKNVAVLYGCPGRHLFKDLDYATYGAVRGLWAGGGRLFVVQGTSFVELASDGTIITRRTAALANDGNPAQIFGNGNQLLIVSGGYAYCDNGAGPVLCRFQIAGTVTAVGAVLTWQSGDYFTAEMVGRPIEVNGHQFLVTGYTAATPIVEITLSASLGSSTGTVVTGYLNEVWWATGDQFTPAMVGFPIIIGAVTYTVASVLSPTALTVTAESLPVLVGVAYSTALPNLSYSAPSGTPVTAVTGAYLDASFYVQRPAAAKLGIASATAANPAELTASAPHGLVTGDKVLLTGATGVNWSLLNGIAWPVTVTSSTKFTIPLNSTTFGALTGTVYALPPDYGRQVNFSDGNNGTSWRGINFKTKEGAADYLRSILVDSEVIYIFGTETIEAWQNDPSTGLPVRIPGAMQKYGGLSAWGPAAINNKVYFVGGNAQGGPIAYRIDGSTPTRISTHAEEGVWAAAGFGPACTSYAYTEEGHVFWAINFGAQTWVWDETTKLWHRRMAWSGTDFAAYTTRFHVYIPEWGTGKHITAGDGLTGYVYESSVNFYDDNGADMAWRRAVPYRYNAGNRIFFGRMTLELETGTAAAFTVASATNANPAVLTKVAHGLVTGELVSFSGATGNWALPLNGIQFAITKLSADTFSIPLNSIGLGALTGAVVLSPGVVRDYSDDHGQTFVQPRAAAVGAHNDYTIRLYWLRNGSSRGRVWRFFGAGKHKVALIDLQCDEVLGLS